MDIPIPAFLSTCLLVAAALCYRITFTPNRPTADASIRVETGIGRLIPEVHSLPITVAMNQFAYVHIALEIYSLWTAKGHETLLFCPASSRETAHHVYPDQRLPLSTMIPLGFVVFGGALRGTCYRLLGKLFTWQTSIFKDHQLITSGPYGFVRHPAYTAVLSVIIGYTWFLFTPGTFAKECLMGAGFPPSFVAQNAIGIAYATCWLITYLDNIIFLFRRSLAEDVMLKRKFGKEWDEWASRVRWGIVPYVF